MWRPVIGLILICAVAFSSGAFGYFIYPGQSETVTQVAVEVTPVMERCEHFWLMVVNAQTERAVADLRRNHPDRDCARPNNDTAGPPPLALP